MRKGWKCQAICAALNPKIRVRKKATLRKRDGEESKGWHVTCAGEARRRFFMTKSALTYRQKHVKCRIQPLGEKSVKLPNCVKALVYWLKRTQTAKIRCLTFGSRAAMPLWKMLGKKGAMPYTSPSIHKFGDEFIHSGQVLSEQFESTSPELNVTIIANRSTTLASWVKILRRGHKKEI